MLSAVAKLPLLVKNFDATVYHLNRSLLDYKLPGTRLQPVSLETVFPGIMGTEVTIHNALERIIGRSIELDELATLLMICRFTKAKSILEVGTLFGNTTLNLAANSEGNVITIDLPPAILVDGEKHGTQFRVHPLGKRIIQVYGDSARLDWHTLGGPFDLIFLDGCPTSEHVGSDSENALKHLSRTGVIVWHNYVRKSVSRVIDSYVQQGMQMTWISGTKFVVYRTGI